MQVIPINKHSDSRAEALEKADECVQFGFCVSVCPTYVLTRDEDESPRGRIDLMREMLASNEPPKHETVRHIDQCLSCLSCMSTCAVRVDYVHLIDEARAHVERTYARRWSDRLMRRMVAALVPHPKRLRTALSLARLGQPLAGLLPSRLRGMMALAARAATQSSRGQDRTLVHSARIPQRMRVALLAGCAQQVLGPQINQSTIRVLTRFGCEVFEPEARCCGALTLHMGRVDEGRSAAAAMIEALLEQDRRKPIDAFVITASGCGTTIKDYEHLFRADPGRHADASRAAQLALDVTEALQRLDLPRLPPNGIRVAYHDACSLQHGQGVRHPPRMLLERVGFEVVDVPEGHFCCGSAGTYNMLQPEMAAQLGARKASHIESTGAEMVCAGNLGCLEQLGGYLSMPIVHTIELIDWATGGPRPAALPDLWPERLRPEPGVKSQP